MKYCRNCDKEYKKSKSGFCEICEEKLEEKMEHSLPVKIVRELKRRPLIYLAAVLVVVLALGGLGATLIASNKSLNAEKQIVAALNQNLEDSKSELEILKANLSKTEEGRKQLETAKGELESQKSQLETRATSAESAASKAKTDLNAKSAELTAKTTELNSKTAQLNQVSSDLTAKQAELTKVNQCVALFNSVNNTLTLYDEALANASSWYQKTVDYLNQGDTASAQAAWNEFNNWADKADSYYAQIKSTVNKVQSGNCQ